MEGNTMTTHADTSGTSGTLGRSVALLYGVATYIIFLCAFLYAILFVGNLIVPKSIDSGPAGPIPAGVLIDALLLGLFAIQHSVMARVAFKRWWTSIIPRPVERSTYVLISSLLLLLLFWQWRPLTAIIWHIDNAPGSFIIWCLFWAGWLIVLLSTFMVSHFDLFGLRQVYLHLRNKQYKDIGFKAAGLYKLVRHPIMLGFLIAFWAAPVMTAGHLLFSVATTAYILLALQLEEHDLVRAFGDTYQAYRRQVFMLLPWRKRAS
jgi:methanethiol S-methyltransferase